jgi:short-subunit dehydrogenase
MANETKVVVITGASSGIGAALARRLGDDGHRLVLAARREAQLREVASESEVRGAAGTCVFPADVTRREDVLRLRDVALDAFGRFDVWVNNAGRGITRPVLELRDFELDEMIGVNVKSALYGMQAAVPYFIKRGGFGHVINVSSFLGRVPVAGFRSAYSAAKAALNSLTTNLRMDLREEYPDIHVTLVMPGVVTTEFARNVLGEARPPLLTAGQAQTAEEVAEVIALVIQNPVPEVYTNPASPEVVRRFYADPGGFEPTERGARSDGEARGGSAFGIPHRDLDASPPSA